MPLAGKYILRYRGTHGYRRSGNDVMASRRRKWKLKYGGEGNGSSGAEKR